MQEKEQIRSNSLLPSELKHSVRLIGWVTIQKFCLATLIFYVLLILKPLVYKDLHMIYLIFCGIVSAYIVSPSITNPGLSVWQAYYLLFARMLAPDFFVSRKLTTKEKTIIR